MANEPLVLLRVITAIPEARVRKVEEPLIYLGMSTRSKTLLAPIIEI
jgi:hypothetical protein